MPNFTEQDTRFLKKLKEQGVPAEEAFARLDAVRNKLSQPSVLPQEEKGFLGKSVDAVKRFGSEVAQGFKEGEQRGEDLQAERIKLQEEGKVPKLGPISGLTTKGLEEVAAPVLGALEAALDQPVVPVLTDEAIERGTGPVETIKSALKGDFKLQRPSEVVGEVIQEVPAAQKAVTFLAEKFNSLPKEKQLLLQESGLGLETILSFVGGGAAKKSLTKGVETATDVARAGKQIAEKTVVPMAARAGNLSAEFIDDLASKTKQILPKTLMTPEEQVAFIKANQSEAITSLAQELPKIDPSFRRQLSGKEELVQEYVARAVAANADVTNPSPLAYGAERATKAMNMIEEQIKDVGSDIGAFRQKIATVKGSPEAIQPALNTLESEAAKFGLTLDENGKFIPSKSRVTKLSKTEIQKLNEMRSDLLNLKGDPKSLRIIDVRSKIDSNIKFSKDRQDISDNLDGLSRSVRSKLAKANENIIGREQSKLLAEYSELNDLLFDFRKLSSKGNNQEFFIKRVMSERDRIPKEAMARIKEATGINLLDDAILTRLVTDNIGSNRLKGLFEQEITSAGIDIASTVLTKRPLAAAGDIAVKGLKRLLPKTSEQKIIKFVEQIAKDENRLAELEEILKSANVK